MEPLDVVSRRAYGPLQADFEVQVPVGYSVLVGSNNQGKTSILLAAFKHALNNGVPRDRAVFIPSQRGYLAPSTQPGTETLDSYNNRFLERITRELIENTSPNALPQLEMLPTLLLNHSNFLQQVHTLNNYLRQLELPDMELGGAQAIRFDRIQGHFQGSGLRSLLPILAALSDTQLQFIAIDEPETALHPALQRRLRDLLMECATDRYIVVASHSPLMLDRHEVARNLRVCRSEQIVTVAPVQDSAELMDITFDMLGSSLDDVFFPTNFIVVEGSSDQVIVEAVLRLLAPTKQIKVLAAGGADGVGNLLGAVTKTLRPIVTRDSPYASRVVAMLDRPNHQQQQLADSLRTTLGPRLLELPETSLEDYLPDALFVQAKLDKSTILHEIREAHGDYSRLSRVKHRCAAAIAACLTIEDIEQIPEIKGIVELAVRLSTGRP